MNASSEIISKGLVLAQDALVDLMGRENLHLRPKTMPRARRSKASGCLKHLEMIVRRLILLMALALKPAAPCRKPDVKSPLPLDGVEIVTFPTVAVRRLKLLPRLQDMTLGAGFPDLPGVVLRDGGQVCTTRLLARLAALHHVLAAPEAHASRLAHALRRLKEKGEPRPMVGAAPPVYGLRPELGAVSTLLPVLLTRALGLWDDTG